MPGTRGYAEALALVSPSLNLARLPALRPLARETAPARASRPRSWPGPPTRRATRRRTPESRNSLRRAATRAEPVSSAASCAGAGPASVAIAQPGNACRLSVATAPSRHAAPDGWTLQTVRVFGQSRRPPPPAGRAAAWADPAPSTGRYSSWPVVVHPLTDGVCVAAPQSSSRGTTSGHATASSRVTPIAVPIRSLQPGE